VVPVTQKWDRTERPGYPATDGFAASTIEGIMIITVTGDQPFNSIDIANKFPQAHCFCLRWIPVASKAASESAAGTIGEFVARSGTRRPNGNRRCADGMLPCTG